MKIVVSAINLRSGGTLSVLLDVLKTVNQKQFEKITFVFLISSKKLIPFETSSHIEFIEFPVARSAYIVRLYYEYCYFYFLSRKIKPDFWLSLHDTSPILHNTAQGVYFHNPTPFSKPELKELILQPKLFLFKILYTVIYRFNIHSNNYVIVQQNWIKTRVVENYGIKDDKVIVAIPKIDFTLDTDSIFTDTNQELTFFYPAFPRLFKNFEIIAGAMKTLENEGIKNYRVLITINGRENLYSRYVKFKFRKIKNIHFTGLLTREKTIETLNNSKCLLFPSKLETWGLPLSEAIFLKKDIIVSDLDYAKATVGNYSNVSFFNPNDKLQLARIMKEYIKNRTIVRNRALFEIKSNHILESWEETIKFLVQCIKK
jgi:glycosyltransferase involved in cell wall biosynthesis